MAYQGIASLSFEVSSPAVAATGEIAFSGTGADGNEIEISDGSTTCVFELDSNATIFEGSYRVVVGASAAATATNLAAALQASPLADRLIVEDNLSGTLNLTSRLLGTAGNVDITKSGADITVDGMSGGANAALTLAYQDDHADPSLTIVRHRDGSIGFTDAGGREVRFHSDQAELSRLFTAIVASLNGSTAD